MPPTPLVLLAVLTTASPSPDPQSPVILNNNTYLPSARTNEGDFLQNLGNAAAGLGSLAKDWAVAGSINTDTAIRWDQYVRAVTRYEAWAYRNRRNRILTHRRELYDAIRKRMREAPEVRDVLNGDTLNEQLEAILDPAFAAANFEYINVEIPVDLIRRIPFKVADENLVFSMDRLSPRGPGEWSVALHDAWFDRERRAYTEAMHGALEQIIDLASTKQGKTPIAAIKAVEDRLDALEKRLDQGLTPQKETLYIKARNHLKEMRKTVQALKVDRAAGAVAQISQYGGTTVRDLAEFMRDHHLGFAPATTPAERSVYSELYEAVRIQLEKKAVLLDAGTEGKVGEDGEGSSKSDRKKARGDQPGEAAP